MNGDPVGGDVRGRGEGVECLTVKRVHYTRPGLYRTEERRDIDTPRQSLPHSDIAIPNYGRTNR